MLRDGVTLQKLKRSATVAGIKPEPTATKSDLAHMLGTNKEFVKISAALLGVGVSAAGTVLIWNLYQARKSGDSKKIGKALDELKYSTESRAKIAALYTPENLAARNAVTRGFEESIEKAAAKAKAARIHKIVSTSMEIEDELKEHLSDKEWNVLKTSVGADPSLKQKDSAHTLMAEYLELDGELRKFPKDEVEHIYEKHMEIVEAKKKAGGSG
jgi:hypothetical protein